MRDADITINAGAKAPRGRGFVPGKSPKTTKTA